MNELVGAGQNDSHADEQAAFVEAIATGIEAGCGVGEGMTVQRIVDAIYRSSDIGSAVSLPEPTLEPQP